MLSLCACMVNDLLTPLEAAEDTTSMICNPEVNGCRTQTNWSIIAISAHIECTTHPLMTQAPFLCKRERERERERERMNTVPHTIYNNPIVTAVTNLVA